MYDEIGDVVIEVLDEFGASYSVSRTGSDGSVQQLSLVGIQASRVEEEMPGTGIQIGDWRMIFKSVEAPKKGDRITLNNGVHTIMQVEEIAPAKVVMGYWAWARLG